MDYRFLKDEKDPIIDLIRTEAQDQLGELRGETLSRLAYNAGVSESTLRNWFFGDTHRPQNITVRMVLAALECKVKIVRSDGTEIRGPRHVNKGNGRKSEKVSAKSQAAAGAA
jgi:lambda repressor-like predicted transcriptional regulator